MDEDRLKEIEKRHDVPPGLLRKIIDVENEFLYQTGQSKSILPELEKLIREHVKETDT